MCTIAAGSFKRIYFEKVDILFLQKIVIAIKVIKWRIHSPMIRV